MEARGRGRRVIKWGGLVLCAGILGLWVVSLRWEVEYYHNEYQRPGTVYYAVDGMIWSEKSNIHQQGFHVQKANWVRRYVGARFGLSLPGRKILRLGTKYWLPLWLPFSVAAIPTAVVLIADARRVRANRLAAGRKAERLGKRMAGVLATTSFPILLCGVWLLAETVCSWFVYEDWGLSFIIWWGSESTATYKWAAALLVVAVVSYVGAWLVYERLRWRWVIDPTARCMGCGYDLRGNVSGRCPECGAVIGTHSP